MTVVYEGIRINREAVLVAIEGQSVFDAQSVAYRLGYRNIDSNHGAYRPVLRILNRLHAERLICKGYFGNNTSIFWNKTWHEE